MKQNKRNAFSNKKKQCPFKESGFTDIDYKNVDLLLQFIAEGGKILPRRMKNVSRYFQRKLRKAIMRARHVGFLPFVD